MWPHLRCLGEIVKEEEMNEAMQWFNRKTSETFPWRNPAFKKRSLNCNFTHHSSLIAFFLNLSYVWTDATIDRIIWRKKNRTQGEVLSSNLLEDRKRVLCPKDEVVYHTNKNDDKLKFQFLSSHRLWKNESIIGLSAYIQAGYYREP